MVLTRRYNDKINIYLPDKRVVTITVVDLRDDKVRLGLDAPDDILILRGEVAGRIEGGEPPRREGGAA